jgi:beta-lactamase regulating signal transducer with metallopeptidase domain
MDRIAEAAVTFVINAAWQSAVIALIGIGAARLLRRAPARLRFTLVALTLISAVAAPVMTLVPRSVPRTPGAVSVSGSTANTIAIPHEPVSAMRPSLNLRSAEVVAVLYVIGLLLAAGRLLAAARRTRRLLANSQAFADGIRISDEVASPVTIGATILIPRSLAASDLAASLLGAAIAHERAHIRRRDFAVNAFLQLAALPLWFHPAAFFLRREIAELRELACDEEAAGQSSPRAYAAALVRIASMTARRDFALGMSSTPIERRVALLRHPFPRSQAMTIVAIVAIAILPVALFAACSRTSIAPAIAAPRLDGNWSLVAAQSDFHMMVPRSYDIFTQSIAQDAHAVQVRQHRVAGGRAEDHAWRVVTDGKWRAVDGIPQTNGRAEWRNGRLTLCLKGPGAHSETAAAWISGGRLVCDGDTERGHYHAVFQRED